MDRKDIENNKNLKIIEVSKNSVVKRYEITANDGYSIRNDDNDEVEIMIFPAKLGLDNILAQINVEEK